jgi:hypothetical protein
MFAAYAYCQVLPCVVKRWKNKKSDKNVLFQIVSKGLNGKGCQRGLDHKCENQLQEFRFPAEDKTCKERLALEVQRL